MRSLWIFLFLAAGVATGVALVNSCGGGGGSEFTPSIPYSGVDLPANITGENAVNLATGAYLGMEYIGLAGNTISLSVDEGTGAPAETIILNRLFLSRFWDRAGGTFLNDSGTLTASPLASAALTIPGYCEGYAEVTGTVNEKNGNFDLDVLFQDYSDDCVVYFNGNANMKGGYPDLYIDHMTVIYDVLDVTGYDVDLTLSGKWSMDIRGWPHRETINIVTLDNSSGKTWWLKDYEIITYSQNEQEITGRFYDPDFGYVDLATEQPFKFDPEDKFPFEGQLSLNGADSSIARLDIISSAAFRTTCDEDGNGTTDFDSGIIHWPGQNNIPIAVTGADQNIHVNSPLVLNGTLSSDEDGDPLNYNWTIAAMPTGSQAVLSNPHDGNPTFIPDYHGQYTVELTVDDGTDSSLPAQVLITATLFDQGTVIYSLASPPEAVAIADVNSDGRNDVIMKSGYYIDEENDLKLFIFPQNEYGQLLLPIKYDTKQEHGAGELPSVDVGDLNSDGRVDVAIPLFDSVELFFQDSTGSLVGSNIIPCSVVGKLKIADVENDLDDDIVMKSGGDMLILFQDSFGSLSSSSTFISDGFSWAYEIADMNNDGLKDIVTIVSDPQFYFAVLYQGPDNSFGDSINFTPVDRVTGGAGPVGIGDLNGDTLKDVVISFFDRSDGDPVGEPTLGIFFQDISGGFQLGKTYSGMFSGPQQFKAIKTADVNEDGKADIITTGPYGLRVYLQGINNDFSYYHYGGYGNRWSDQGLAIGDIDGDGDLDVVNVFDTVDLGKLVVHYNFFY